MKWTIILLFLFSCTAIKKQANIAKQASIHDIYILTELAGKNVKGKTNKQATLDINLEKMSIGGLDGCNQFGGKIEQHDASKMVLTFSDVYSTQMYCDEISNEIGQAFYKVAKYKQDGLTLHLLTQQDEILLTYRKVD